MFVLFRYENKGRIGSMFQHGKPVDWCEDESEIEGMVHKHIDRSHNTDDYIEVDDPSNVSITPSQYGRSSVKGYAVATLPNFNPNEGPGYKDATAEPNDLVRRYDEFSVDAWRKKSVENEKRLCELTGMVFRPK